MNIFSKKASILCMGLIFAISGYFISAKTAQASYIDIDGHIWVFNFNVPTDETSLKINFTDWVNNSSGIRPGSNIQLYSAQSSDAPDEDHIVTINAANAYETTLNLVPLRGDKVHIIVKAFEFIDDGDNRGNIDGYMPKISNADIETPSAVTPPVITLLGESTINLTVGDTYADAGATATDDVDGDITNKIVVGGDTVDANKEGTYRITYNVSDTSGKNAVEVIRTVIVSESTSSATPPQLFTEINITPSIIDLNVGATKQLEMTTSPSSASATATFIWSSDNTDVAEVDSSGLVTAVSEGTANITASSDSVISNKSVITVKALASIGDDSPPEDTTTTTPPISDPTENPSDETPPVITLLGESTINLTVGDTYADAGATATDDVDGDITNKIVVGGDTVDANKEGTYRITYNVSDTSGKNAVEVIRTVIVSELSVQPDPLSFLYRWSNWL